jgi:hypothetical protein
MRRRDLPSPLAASKPARPRESDRHRYDFATLPYREPEKLSLRVCLLLIVATSVLLWIAAIEAIGVVW